MRGTINNHRQLIARVELQPLDNAKTVTRWYAMNAGMILCSPMRNEKPRNDGTKFDPIAFQRCHRHGGARARACSGRRVDFCGADDSCRRHGIGECDVLPHGIPRRGRRAATTRRRNSALAMLRSEQVHQKTITNQMHMHNFSNR